QHMLYKYSSSVTLRERHCHICLVRFVDLQHSPRSQAHEGGNERIWNLLDADIECVHRIVIELAAISNLIFGRSDALLELLEVAVGLQVGIVLRHRKETAQCRSHTLVCLCLLINSNRLLILAAGLRDFGQRIALEVCVSLGDVEQFTQLVMPLLQKNIDVCPSLVDVILDRNEAVIDRDQVNEEARNREQESKQNNHVHNHLQRVL